MDIDHTILLFGTMLLLSAIVYPVATRLQIPFSALLLLSGYIFGETITGLGVDTGLRWHHLKEIVFYVFLPVLIFESALNINSKALFRNLPVVLLLAIPVMLLTTFIIALILFFGINHPGFPWIAALICGALLSATDPVSVLDMFKRFNISERLTVLMEGESLFNDAMAIVLFSLLLGIALEPTRDFAWYSPVIDFLYVMLGGILFGLIFGLISILANRWLNNTLVFTSASLALTYLSFIGAEVWLHVSGVMAVLSYGLCLGSVIKRETRQTDSSILLPTWRFLAFLANALVFMLVGLTFTLKMFGDMWLGMLLGILAVLIARAIGVYGSLPILSIFGDTEPLTRRQYFIVYWGGLRGAIAVALVLSLPLEFDAWYTVQSITYGVVLFSVFIQAPVLYPVLKRSR